MSFGSKCLFLRCLVSLQDGESLSSEASVERPLYLLVLLAFQVSLNPVRVLNREADEEKAEVARLSSFVGAMAIGDLVKSTLGPKGMDKILWGMGRNEGQVEVTNDGATILKAVGVDNPAAKVNREAKAIKRFRLSSREPGENPYPLLYLQVVDYLLVVHHVYR